MGSNYIAYMSWDVASEKNKTCPCTKGTYTVTIKSDDWGRFEEFWVMNCSSCKDIYVLRSDFTAFPDPGEAQYYWIKKSKLKESEKLKVQATKLSDEIISIAKKEYFEAWIQHFYKKSKKSVWHELTNNGSNYPSLSTFYSHIKEKGMEEYLTDFFEHNNVSALRIVNVENAKIDSLREEANKLYEQADDLLRRNKILERE